MKKSTNNQLFVSRDSVWLFFGTEINASYVTFTFDEFKEKFKGVKLQKVKTEFFTHSRIYNILKK